MLEKNKYVQQIIRYLSDLSSQRTMLYLAIAAVSICLILIVLGFVFPKGIPIDNQTLAGQPVHENPNRVVTTDAGITSTYTAKQAVDFVKEGFKSESLTTPDCSPEEAQWNAFFSHRKYWKISVACANIYNSYIFISHNLSKNSTCFF